MKQSFFLLLIIFCVTVTFGQGTSGVPYTKYGIYDTDGIRPEEYRSRRLTVMAKMASFSVAIFRAQDYANRSGDIDYRFRQNSTFLYLTGCTELNCTLILIPDGYVLDDGKIVKEILFVVPKTKEWAGENLGIEGAREILGFGSVGNQSVALTNERLKEILVSILSNYHVLYYTPSLVETLLDPVSDIRFISWRESMKNLQEKFRNLDVKGISAIVGDVRAVKSASELELIQKAVDATIAAHIESMKSCEPGMFEYQLQAVIEYCFTKAGAEYPAFPSIVASGPNSQMLHYSSNRRKILSGDLVIVDIGAEYHGYSADITRTLPVSGKFSPAQKEIYELVLHAQQEAIDTVAPGVMMTEVEEKAKKVIVEGLIRLGIARDLDDAKKYCSHTISHFIGLDVHDGRSNGNVPGKVVLVPGMVVAVEPGIYIPEGSDCPQKYWNIGIRIEDDVVVTEEGRSVLSAFAPQTSADIEMLMKKKGIGNQEVGKE